MRPTYQLEVSIRDRKTYTCTGITSDPLPREALLAPNGAGDFMLLSLSKIHVKKVGGIGPEYVSPGALLLTIAVIDPSQPGQNSFKIELPTDAFSIAYPTSGDRLVSWLTSEFEAALASGDVDEFIASRNYEASSMGAMGVDYDTAYANEEESTHMDELEAMLEDYIRHQHEKS